VGFLVLYGPCQAHTVNLSGGHSMECWRGVGGEEKPESDYMRGRPLPLPRRDQRDLTRRPRTLNPPRLLPHTPVSSPFPTKALTNTMKGIVTLITAALLGQAVAAPP